MFNCCVVYIWRQPVRFMNSSRKPFVDQIGIDRISARNLRHRNPGRPSLLTNPAFLFSQPKPSLTLAHGVHPSSTIDGRHLDHYQHSRYGWFIKHSRKKFVLNERIAKSVPPKGRLEDCIELSLKFLSSPWNIWKNGDLAMRQTVLRLAFAEPLRYRQNGVYETQKFPFPSSS